jgi:hypothetical protein
MIEAALAVWPWWTGPLLLVWWASLIEAQREVVEYGDPLRAARGVVLALTFMVTLVWVVCFLFWLGGRA